MCPHHSRSFVCIDVALMRLWVQMCIGSERSGGATSAYALRASPVLNPLAPSIRQYIEQQDGA